MGLRKTPLLRRGVETGVINAPEAQKTLTGLVKMKKIGREPRKVATIIDGALTALVQQAIVCRKMRGECVCVCVWGGGGGGGEIIIPFKRPLLI